MQFFCQNRLLLQEFLHRINKLICVCLLTACFIFAPLCFATKLSLSSEVLKPNGFIPTFYTCDGENISPPLQWDDKNPETQSYVLLVEDPDAPGGQWVHWLLFNIPKNIDNLPAKTLISFAKTGKNSWGSIDYKGPCPPFSSQHRYFFRLYALDSLLNLPEEVSIEELQQAMNKHILDQAFIMVRYRR